MRTIKFKGTGHRYMVSEEGTLAEFRLRFPLFFSAPGLKPESETFTVYRGQLITHQIVKLSDNIPRNHLVVNMYLRQSLDNDDRPDLFCVSASALNWVKFDEEAAHRLIDLILDGGEYEYSMAAAVS